MVVKTKEKIGVQKNEVGEISIGKFKASELVEKYGTPLLVYNEQVLRDIMQQYVSGFEKYYPQGRAVYAGKAFLSRTICRIANEEGLGLDVVSGGEIYTALKAGFPADRMIFHGNNKLPQELEMGVKAGLGLFVIDNEEEAYELRKKAEEFGKKVDALIRIAPGIDVDTHKYIKTGSEDSKFGISLKADRIFDILQKMADDEFVNIRGFHAHIGSQIKNGDSYSELIRKVFLFFDEIREKIGLTYEVLDLGGGVGIDTMGNLNVSIPDLISELVDIVKDEAEKFDYPLPEIIMEPGRSIAGPAGITLYRAGYSKVTPNGKKYISVDGGMTDNIRPALYEADYEAHVDGKPDSEEKETITIAGKCCESGDIMIEDARIHPVQSGDIVAVPATGAYTYSMSSNYNGIPRPAVVLIDGDKDNLIIKRESYADLINRDIVPENY